MYPTQNVKSLRSTSIVLWNVALAACIPIGMDVISYLPHGKLIAVFGCVCAEHGICQKALRQSNAAKYFALPILSMVS